MRRELRDLNLIDDFLFGQIVSYPAFGEEFCKLLLSILLQREMGKLKVVPQKVLPGKDTDSHGSRLDVYIEESLGGDMDVGEVPDLFDVETEKKAEKKAALPYRVRYYHSGIDSWSLKSGTDYLSLRRVYVIIISTFDPFDCDQVLYTIRNCCSEVPELEYDDGVVTLYFYTKGSKGTCAEEIRALLHFMEYTNDANAVTSKLEKIREMVRVVKQDPMMEVAYMRAFERDEMIREEGREEGRILERIDIYRNEDHLSDEEIIRRIMSKFNLSEEAAKDYVLAPALV